MLRCELLVYCSLYVVVCLVELLLAWLCLVCAALVLAVVVNICCWLLLFVACY